jgi:methylated-DNA-[protein]-cysteine S-methyltransferase
MRVLDHEMIIETPIGPLHAAFDDAGRLTELGFAGSGRQACGDLRVDETRHKPEARSLVTQLRDYFAGTRETFEIALAPRGTEFQLAVWYELLNVPYGHTITYAELARRIGKPSAVRAVGAANGANPIPVIVPCHRVIGSNGTLTGYGGGIERKQWLLALEGRRLF